MLLHQNNLLKRELIEMIGANKPAKAKIAVEDNQLIDIKHEETAKGMWNSLRKVYEQRHLSTKLFLQRKLYSMKYDENLNMTGDIQNVLEVVDQLRGLGKVIRDDDIVAILLCGVPESYYFLITSLEARPSEEL